MNSHFRLVVIALVLLSGILLLSMIPLKENEHLFHSPEELERFLTHGTLAPPLDSSILFPTASTCSGCHGYDLQMHGMVDGEGNDVNVNDDWRSTMMANSAKDPFWRAKVSHEILVNPNHSLELQT